MEQVTAALQSGWLATLGPDVDAFELAAAGRVDRAHALALSSGTAALHLALLGLGATPGRAVIVPTMTFAASALASLTLLRYIASGGMAVVGVPFYENMGVQYTVTILACLSVPLVPVPYIFYRYGEWIRSKSKYAINSTTGKK